MRDEGEEAWKGVRRGKGGKGRGREERGKGGVDKAGAGEEGEAGVSPFVATETSRSF